MDDQWVVQEPGSARVEAHYWGPFSSRDAALAFRDTLTRRDFSSLLPLTCPAVTNESAG